MSRAVAKGYRLGGGGLKLHRQDRRGNQSYMKAMRELWYCEREGAWGELSRKFLKAMPFTLAINVSNALFPISELYWSSTRLKQFLKTRRKCLWLAGIMYCIERRW